MLASPVEGMDPVTPSNPCRLAVYTLARSQDELVELHTESRYFSIGCRHLNVCLNHQSRFLPLYFLQVAVHCKIRTVYKMKAENLLDLEPIFFLEKTLLTVPCPTAFVALWHVRTRCELSTNPPRAEEAGVSLPIFTERLEMWICIGNSSSD